MVLDAMPKSKKTINVFLVDRQLIFREGVRSVLSKEGMTILGEAAALSKVLSLLNALSPNIPDVVLLGVDSTSLTSPRDFNLVRQITVECSPNTPVILLTDYMGEKQFLRGIKAGVAALLTRDASPSDLLTTIRDVYKNGHSIIKNLFTLPRVASRILNQFQELFRIETTEIPSPIVADILGLIALGKNKKQIAYALKLDEQAIDGYLLSVLHKISSTDPLLTSAA